MKSTELLILIPKRSSRLIYIINHYCKEFFGLEPNYSIDTLYFQNFEGPKIHYGYLALGDEFFIAADDFIFEKTIQDEELKFGKYNNTTTIFQTYASKSAYPFDIFSASFYFLSRYEEYLPYISDKYGRFRATESISFKNNFLQKPLIDIWAIDLKNKLQVLFPTLKFKTLEFNFINTIDVDVAFSYKNKDILRKIGGYLKNIKDLNLSEIKERTKVFLGKEKDPFDTFDYLFELNAKHNLESIFFILFADYGSLDKNIPVNNKAFQDLLNYISDNSEIGIHPSYNSNKQPQKLKKEITDLQNTIHREITKSRQHFLVLNMPITYRRLIENGITDDYSMGFAAQIGFRASTSRSFLFYDLEMEIPTNLRIHPFAAMEGSLHDYQNKNPEEAYLAFVNIIDEVKAVNGTFISLWHNNSINNKGQWLGWKEVYEKTINYILTNE